MASGGAASSSGPHNGKGVWIFVDDSNIWIEAKKLAASLRGMKTKEDPRVRVDIGKLGNFVAAGRYVNKGTLYGSEPPPNDTVWDSIRNKGWEVRTYQRSGITGKEKKVDTKMVADVTKLVCVEKNLRHGNTVIIITGDADIMPAVEIALETEQWKVEVRIWKSGLSRDIHRASKEYPGRMTVDTLDDHLGKIAFINYHFNVKKRNPDLLLQNAVVLVNPQQEVDEDWKWKMDKECQYPFQYYKSSVPGTSDQLVVVVFSMLGTNGLADMLVKIRRSSDLNLNAQQRLAYFEWYNSTGGDGNGHLGFDDLEKEDDCEEPFTVVKSTKAKPKPKQQYSAQCDYKFKCKYGRDCRFAHTDAEKQFFRKRDREQSKEERTKNAQGYKTTLCNYFTVGHMCRNGDSCPFAHGDADAICIKCHDRGHFTKDCPEGRLNP